ncbi:oligomeric Golgi complex subunit 7 [Amanita rubescens]|nr:oligomeric Golgi complex subunit 7 [Amanita rubescens]
MSSTAASISPLEFIASLEKYDNALAWINDTLNDDMPELAELDQHVTQLIAALDVAYDDASSQLERIIDDVSRSDAASSLQPSLAELIQKSKATVPEQTADALDQLRVLDTVKKRMEAARDVLREAESWSTLELEVTSLLAEHNYTKAADRLSEAGKSMVVFENTPEYDPRRTLLVNLQNQLEASLSSALVSAIKAQDISACRQYYAIFSAISRESEFRNYYYASRKSTLVAMWQDVKLSDSDSNAPVDSLSIVDYLPNASRSLLYSPTSAATLSTFITTALSTLQPTMSQRLAHLASHSGERAILPLISVFRATEEFAVEVEKIMEKLKYASQPLVDAAARTDIAARHVRRRSSRMSMSWQGGQLPIATASLPVSIIELDWDQEVFQPFIEFQVDYGILERSFLENALREFVNDDDKDQTSNDYARLLRERAVDVFGVAEGSLSRCDAFTHGFGSVGLVQALDSTFESFIQTWTANVQTAIIVATPFTPSLIAQDDLSDMDYTAQDWSTFQTLIRLLASGQAYEERLSIFESKLRTKLAEFANRFRLSRNDPTNFGVASTRGQGLLLAHAESDQPQSARLGITITSQPTHILVRVRQAVHGFATACQTSLQQTILSPLKRYLKSYPSMPVWSLQDSQKLKHSGATHSLQIPTFSLSPSETVQRIGEGLLNIPRLFEVYAYDDGLSFSLNTLPFVNAETIKSISDQSEASAPPATRRRSTSARQQHIDPGVVSSAWLFSLGKGFVDHIIVDILPQISSLSKPGATQLASDLEYLSNIVRVLNVESEDLEEWRRCVAMDDEEGRKAFTQASADSIMQHFGRIRGWDK